MSEHDDEIRAKCQWLVDNKHITSPVETGMLICEVFDAFKEIATLKAQLKTKDRLIEIYSNSNNWETPSGQAGWFEPCEEDELFIKELETVKARSA